MLVVSAKMTPRRFVVKENNTFLVQVSRHAVRISDHA